MLPFYHPTSVVALDDDPLFLESFAFHFGDDFICNTFTQADDALRCFEKLTAFQMLGEDFFTSETGVLDSTGSTSSEQLIKMNDDHMIRLMGDENRFQQISLLVVDYAMPGMNGVEVCRRLKGHPARKILLTGKAGEETAVKAFNEGIIDCFLMKQMADLPRVLEQEMRKLQRKYFNEQTSSLQLALGIQNSSLATHSAFNEHFLKIFEARGVVEYYRHTRPGGVLMVTDEGEVMFLVIQDDDTMQSSLEIARDLDAPDELLKLLESKTVLTFFPQTEHGFNEDHAHEWRNHIWPAQKLPGAPDLYTCLITGDDVQRYVETKLSTFAAFRNARDDA